MGILFGFILLIIIISLVASKRFASLATSKGYISKRAKMYPVFLGTGAFFFLILGQTILSFTSRSMMTLLFYCWSSLIVLILIAILTKAYKNMKAAPDAKLQPNPKPTTEK